MLRGFRWVIGALPAGSLVLPEPAADFDVSRLDVQQLLAQLRDATIMGARVDLSGPQMLRSVSVPVGRAKKRGNRAKRLARYESVLLCAFLGTELRGDAAERRLDELQQAFGVEDGVHETMWHHLRLSDEATATDIVEQGASPSDVHYRFELLREARPHEFGSREAFVEWVQRQVSVYHRGFAAALGWAAAERREEMAGFGEMVKAMFKNVIDVAASDEEVFPEEGYSDALAACASTTASAYMMLDDAVDPRFHSELSDRPRAYLSYVYPMNTVRCVHSIPFLARPARLNTPCRWLRRLSRRCMRRCLRRVLVTKMAVASRGSDLVLPICCCTYRMN